MQERQRAGFTILEMFIVVTVLGFIAAMAVPSWRQVQANSRLREASAQAIDALMLARARALSSGNNVVVYFNSGLNGGNDLCGNPLQDVVGNPAAILLLDDGPPSGATANCCIDAGDPVEIWAGALNVNWGTTNAGGAAPGDADPNTAYTAGVTFRDQTGVTREWVMFGPDGIPVGFNGVGTCNSGGIGSGGGGVYVTNGNRDHGIVLTPLGGLKAHSWEQVGAQWTN